MDRISGPAVMAIRQLRVNAGIDMSELPLIRSHTRIDFKRCNKKWYWRWCLGLVPKRKSFGALDLGTWLHDALARWYVVGRKRNGHLTKHFQAVSDQAIADAEENGAPGLEIVEAEKLQFLGQALTQSYVQRYGRDPNIEILAVEIPLAFEISDEKGVIAQHKLKPDAVYRDIETRHIWLFEHKSAASIQTSHLVIDDQARPYAAMAEPALKKSGVIEKQDHVKGIMYNFLRKAFPDTRQTNPDGHYLNKNGSVSKRQPPPFFFRHPLEVTNRAKAMTLRRIRQESLLMTLVRNEIQNGNVDPKWIPKTPHKSCPKFCEFFKMCVLEEEGADITDMRNNLYIRRNPYLYEEESTDEPAGFELS